MGEVITFQIGNKANYVGSHVWNSRREAFLVEDFQQPATFYHTGGSKSYPRSIMIDAADNVGKLDTVLEDTRRNVSYVWGGAIQTAVHGSLPEEKELDSKCFSSQGARFWSDFLQDEMHSKSLCELPKWTKGGYFDSYHKGLVGSPMNDTVGVDFVDHVLDNCRYFAEGCDHLSTIEIITEHVGGVAGLTTSLLQALREEFGSSVCIPLWSVSDRHNDLTVLNYDGATLLDSIGAMKDQVSVLDSALFFHSSMEYCNMMVPISLHEILNSIYKGEIPSTPEDRQYNRYLSTAVAAAAISTASSYRERPTQQESYNNADARSAQESQSDARVRKHGGFSAASNEPLLVNAFQWTAVATHRGRLPMAFLEAGFPGILNSQERQPSSTPYTNLEQYLIDAFDTKKYGIRDKVKGYMRSTNPFCVPLSPVPYAFRTVDTSGDNRGAAPRSDFPFKKAFTNLVSVRGASGEDLREALYGQCSEVPYRISSCQLYDAPLYVTVSSPFSNTTEDEADGAQKNAAVNGASAEDTQEHEFGGCAELATAVYTSPLVGQYLAQQAALWQAAVSIPAVAVQLNKAGLDKTECNEVCEQLRELAQRYLSDE